MKSYLLFLATIVPLLFIGCSGSNFTSNSPSKKTSEKNDNSFSDDKEFEEEDDNDLGDSDDGGSEDDGDSLDIDSNTVKRECKSTPTYDPSSILCSLDWNHPNWQVGSWVNAVNIFHTANVSNSAKWISPLANCAVLGTDRLVYVSNVLISEKSAISAHILNDNLGTFRVWNKGDSSEEEFLQPTQDGAHNKFVTQKLDPGRYSVIIETSDYGGFSAAIAAFYDDDGKELRHTSTTKDEWCVFRINSNEDLAKYLDDNASCRQCMIGPKGD